MDKATKKKTPTPRSSGRSSKTTSPSKKGHRHDDDRADFQFRALWDLHGRLTAIGRKMRSRLKARVLDIVG